jgi:mediator of RNA polymerase II transcription subunit 12
LLRPSKTPGASTVDSTARLYRLLDSVDYSVNVRIDRLAYDCMELISEYSTLISTVLKWASSYYREGSHRIYLVTRLLRRWSHLGADIDDGVLSYLHSMMPNRSNDPRVVFRIIAELVRSKTFSTGRYLQWLIATGSVSQGSDISAVSCVPFFLWI